VQRLYSPSLMIQTCRMEMIEGHYEEMNGQHGGMLKWTSQFLHYDIWFYPKSHSKFFPHFFIKWQLEWKQMLLRWLRLPSWNGPYDIARIWTLGVSVNVTGNKNPRIVVIPTESSSTMINSPMLDWWQEHTRGDEFTGNFS
jgi:hypothetical protein